MQRRLRQRHRAHKPPASGEAADASKPVHSLAQLHREFQRTFVPHNYEPDYQDWIDEYEDQDWECQLSRCAALPCQPRFSLLLPLHECNPEHLQRLIDSILQQSYGHWELCIAYLGDATSSLTAELDRVNDHPRIRIDGSAGSAQQLPASALAISSGDFAALIDAEDTLSPDALLEMAEAVNQHPEW